MHKHLQKFYPYALDSNTFVARTFAVLQREYALQPSQLLLAHAICSDAINAIEYPAAGRQMLGPFNLGGLDGYPFVGLTGMLAFAHHVPDNGAALVYYAPHIGLTAQGELGKIRRVGQAEPSACCGAAALALSRLAAGDVPAPVAPADDYQLHHLECLLYAQRERVLSAAYPLREATEVIFEASGRQVAHLLRQTSFAGRYLFVMGAVIINGDWQQGSYQELRRFEQLDLRNKEPVRNLRFSVDNHQ